MCTSGLHAARTRVAPRVSKIVNIFLPESTNELIIQKVPQADLCRLTVRSTETGRVDNWIFFAASYFAANMTFGREMEEKRAGS